MSDIGRWVLSEFLCVCVRTKHGLRLSCWEGRRSWRRRRQNSIVGRENYSPTVLQVSRSVAHLPNVLTSCWSERSFKVRAQSVVGFYRVRKLMHYQVATETRQYHCVYSLWKHRCRGFVSLLQKNHLNMVTFLKTIATFSAKCVGQHNL